MDLISHESNVHEDFSFIIRARFSGIYKKLKQSEGVFTWCLYTAI